MEAWTFTESGRSSRIESAEVLAFPSSVMTLSSAVVVKALSLKSLPVGVSSGKDKWHALQVKPV
jgi:hypothetical protein